MYILSQFSVWFSESLFTIAIIPPTWQYKVYYHIFAVNDVGGSYSVYLKSHADVSLGASDVLTVDSGYIPDGGSVDESKDFTAPSGYTKRCIMIDGVEECGFKQVSTSLAVDFVEANYLKQHATKKDIRTESECISGSAILYNLLNPNLQ